MLKSFIYGLVLPKDVLTGIRSLFSLMSILALFRYATHHNYSAAVSLVVDTYDETISDLFAPIAPLAEALAQLITGFLTVEIDLQPHWKHVFVLMGVYFMSRVGGAYKAKLYYTAVFRLIWGMAVAFLTSVAAGLSIVSESVFASNIIIAMSALVGMLLYELVINLWYASFFREMQAQLHGRDVRSWIDEFIGLSASDIRRTSCAAALVIAGLLIPFSSRIPLPGLIILGMIMFFYGCFWLYWAWRQTFHVKDPVERQEVFWRNSDAVVGISMVNIFIWATLVVVCDAGARVLL